MIRSAILVSILAGVLPLSAQDSNPDTNIVFRSDVALARADAQVVDRDNRAITHLTQQDFVVREDGRPAAIRVTGARTIGPQAGPTKVIRRPGTANPVRRAR